MADSIFDGLISVSDLAMIKNLMGDSVKTEQGVRTQIRQYENGLKTAQQIGFEPVRVSKGVVLVKITDYKIISFKKKIDDFLKKNSPKG